MRARVWPRETVAKLRALMKSGATIKDAAAQLGLAYHQARSICMGHGIPLPGRGGNRSKFDLGQLRELAEARFCTREIAEKMQVHRQTVATYARDNGIAIISAYERNADIANAARGKVSGRALSIAVASTVATSAVVAPSAPYGMSAADAASLTETGGRYRELSGWAQARGMSVTQAQQRWHALGLVVAKEGRG